jgi:hypothetical protein
MPTHGFPTAPIRLLLFLATTLNLVFKFITILLVDLFVVAGLARFDERTE